MDRFRDEKSLVSSEEFTSETALIKKSMDGFFNMDIKDEWKESEHDRDENGRFKGNGGNNKEDNIESEKTEYGEAFPQFKGKPKQAIEHLLKVRRGYVPGAFHRDDIGDIDLVWGNKHYGLKHIEKQRNKKGQDFNKLMEEITDVIEHGKIIDDEWNENMKVIVDETKKILIKSCKGHLPPTIS